MMNQAQVNRGKATEMLRGLQIHLREGENACPLPCFDIALDPRSPEKVWLFQSPRSFFRRMVHVITSAVVLCAIFAVFTISLQTGLCRRKGRTIAEKSRRTGCAFFYRFCILFSISCDSYESDLCRGESSRPSSSAWRVSRAS